MNDNEIDKKNLKKQMMYQMTNQWSSNDIMEMNN